MCVCVCAPGCVILPATAQLQTVSDGITVMYSIYVCLCVGVYTYVYACVCVCGFTHLLIITLCVFEVRNESLVVWQMLCNHANQHPARILLAKLDTKTRLTSSWMIYSALLPLSP